MSFLRSVLALQLALGIAVALVVYRALAGPPPRPTPAQEAKRRLGELEELDTLVGSRSDNGGSQSDNGERPAP